jgi:hypothetical protein
MPATATATARSRLLLMVIATSQLLKSARSRPAQAGPRAGKAFLPGWEAGKRWRGGGRGAIGGCAAR